MGRKTLGEISRVPRIESLKDVLFDADGWKVLPKGPPVPYSSLVGVTVANVSTRGNSTFVMTSSFFELSCPNGPQLLPWDDEVVWSRANGTGYLRGSGQTVQGIGYQRFPSSDAAGNHPYATFSIGAFTPYSNSYNQTTTPSAPRNIIFQSTTTNTDDYPRNITALNCFVTTSTVDAKVSCQGPRSCNVTAVRPSHAYSSSSNATPLDDQIIAEGFFNNFPDASGSDNTAAAEYIVSSILEQYMYFGYNPINGAGHRNQVNLSTVDGALLAERRGRAMNSYFIPSMSLITVTGGTPPASNLSSPSAEASTGDIFPSTRTNATVATFEELFISSNAWFAVLFVSATILFVCAVLGTSLKYFGTRAPDILGHVSSFTRDNPNIRGVPEGGNTLDGFERACLMRHVRVKSGDARPGESVGHIALMSAEGGTGSRLDGGREYY